MSSQFDPMTLTMIDHMMPICYITFFYSLALRDPDQGVAVLDRALHRLVEQCPPLAGNVGWSSANIATKVNVLEVQPTSTDNLSQYPLLRVERRETHSIADWDLADGLFNDTYCPLPLSLATKFPCPIMRWQANVMCDGIVVAVSFHHSVLDAGGFYTIQQELARLCRNPNASHPGTRLMSDFHKGRRCLDNIQGGSLLIDPPLEHRGSIRIANFALPANLVSCRLTLLPGKIRVLRNWCNTQALSPVSSSGKCLSANDVVSGLLWRAIIAARSRSTASRNFDCLEEQSSLVLITEIRRTIIPALPTLYMGNAIVQQVATTDTKLAIESSVSEMAELIQVMGLAQKVHDASKQVTDLHVRSLLLQKQSMFDWRPQFKQGDITSTSLRRMPIYGLDFGDVLGKVVGFDSPDNRIDGTVCMLPASSTSADALWDIRVTLPPTVMSRLRQDRLLKWAMGLTKYSQL